MEYSNMTLAEMRTIAKERGIRSISSLKKAELAELLSNVDKMLKRPQNERGTVQETPAPDKKAETKTSGKNRKPSSARPALRKASGPRKKSEHPARQASEQSTVSSQKLAVEKKPSVKKPAGKHPVEKQSAERPATEKQPTEAAAPDRKPADFDGQEYKASDASGAYADGILEVMQEGYGFIRSDNYMPGERDIYISPAQIRKFALRTGDVVRGPVRRKQRENEKFNALLYIESVNGKIPSHTLKRKHFEAMTPIFPNERIHLDYPGAPLALRIVDLFSPIGKGQRGMIVSPPKAGKTTLLKQIAKRVSTAYRDMHLLVLLIDERPEEVTDIRESIEGPNVEVIYSTFDELPEHHKRVSEMAIERARRLVEEKEDVMILIDSITRLARAYNLTVSPSGRTLSGGLDPAALHMPKKFFGAARNMREGGSLTILATALIDTGSRMDDMVFEEFKGTGNMELVLDRNLSEERVFPAIDIAKSGTRKDDLLLDPEEQRTVALIHESFRGMRPESVTEAILKLMSKTKDNREFIASAEKVFQSRG